MQKKISAPYRFAAVAVLAVLTVFTVIVSSAHARHFPSELTFPRDADADADIDTADVADVDDDDGTTVSGTILISTDQKFFDGSFTSSNSVYYAPDLEGVLLEQSVWHEMRRDRLANTRQYLGASGALMYPLTNRAWITPGLDWTPVAQYSSDRGGRNALATLDIGPTALVDAFGVPILLRGGISGRRVDSLASFIRVGDYRQSVGAYGAFRVGSEDEMLPFAPVYFYADGLGRRIERSGMASLRSSLLSGFRVGESDSLFIYGAASLFNGREGYLEESADSRAAFFAETPWRIERNVAFTAGYKIGLWDAVEPSLYYSVDQNTLSFPNDTRLRDELTLRQTISAALSTDTSAGIYYDGFIGFTWRDHDKLFGQGNMPVLSTQSNSDSLRVNLWDHAAFDPRTAHRIAIKLPLSLRAIYDVSISRFLTEYPNYYVDGRDTVRNIDDNDRRMRQQRLALEYKRDSTLRVELFGELSDYDLVFLRSAKSSSNRTDNGQKVGIHFDWSPTSELTLTEALYAEAKRGEFHFPAFHQEALQRPRFSRAVNSSLAVDWQTTETVGFLSKWDIKFSDIGFWYGRDYMQAALAADPDTRVDYYAITTKSVYTTIDLAARFNVNAITLETGNSFTVARDRNYRGGYYILTNEDGYSTKPYINATAAVKDVAEISAHVSRMFVIGNRAMSYWDFRLQGAAGF